MVGQRPLGSIYSERGTGSCDGVKLQSTPVSCTRVLLDPIDRLLSSRTHHTLWLSLPNNEQNSTSRTDRLDCVYSLKWFSKSWSVTDAVLIRQLIQRACSLLNDGTPARPTDPSHVASGPLLPSPVNLLGLPTRLPTRAQIASKWIRVSTVVKQSSIVGPAVYCTVLNSRPARNSMLDTEKFFSSLESRESR